MNRIVRFPYIPMLSFAFATTSSISFLPADVALICMNSAFVVCAMTLARVVFPVPGGPYKISELSLSARMARRRRVPSPMMCFCPTTSSNVVGRIRAARGDSFSFWFSLM